MKEKERKMGLENVMEVLICAAAVAACLIL